MSKRSYSHMVLHPQQGYDIHGVGLREAIYGYASAFKTIRGIVKNNSENGSVSIICEGTKKDIGSFSSDISQKLMNDHSLIKIKVPIETNVLHRKTIVALYGDFKEFHIEREDDLHEMVWALQAAGKVFAEQEKKFKERQLAGLSFEIFELSRRLTSLQATAPLPPFRVVAMENFLTQPTILEADFVNIISDIYGTVQELNASNGTLQSNTPKIDQLRRQIETYVTKAKSVKS